MKIYLDWNILVDLYEQNLNEFCNAIINRNEKIIIPYSSIHLNEGQKYNVSHREKDIFNFISQISKNQFLFVDPIETKIIEITPDFVNSYEKIKNEYFSLNSKINYSEIVNLSKQIGFNKQELNNYNYKLIFKKLDEIIGKQEVGQKFRQDLGGNISFNNLVDVFINFIIFFILKKFPNFKNVFTDKYSSEMKIQFSLHLLNAFGYWQEKNNKINSFRLDAYHAVYGSYCDYFITNDKKLYHKIKAIYYNFKIKTEIFLLKKDYLQTIKLVSQ